MQQLQNSKDRTYVSLITRTRNPSRNSRNSLQTRRDTFQVKFTFTRLDAEVIYYHYSYNFNQKSENRKIL